MASLWRTQRPRFPFYFSDGRGRDFYIKYDNGGYWSEQFKINKKPDYDRSRYSNFHTLFHQAAPFKYWGNGRGRETYILKNNGLFHDQKPLCAYHLTDFLRKDLTTKDTKRRIFLSVSEKKYNLALKNLEKKLIKRLYTEPVNILRKSKTNSKNYDLNLDDQYTNTIPAKIDSKIDPIEKEESRYKTVENEKNDYNFIQRCNKITFNNICGNLNKNKLYKKKLNLTVDTRNEHKNLKKIFDYERNHYTYSNGKREKINFIEPIDKSNLKMKAAFNFKPKPNKFRIKSLTMA